MSAMIVFYVLTLHCARECTFGGPTAAIAIYKSLAECVHEEDPRPPPERFTCEPRRVIVNGGALEIIPL
jgi:hypothetical protein